MSEEIAKKKQHSTRELVTGGSIFVASLPVVVFALLVTFMVLVATMGVPPEIRFTLIAVYGSLLAALLFLTWRVIQRSGTLIRRIQGLRREKQRTATLAERDTSRLEISAVEAEMRPEEEQRQTLRKV